MKNNLKRISPYAAWYDYDERPKIVEVEPNGQMGYWIDRGGQFQIGVYDTPSLWVRFWVWFFFGVKWVHCPMAYRRVTEKDSDASDIG